MVRASKGLKRGTRRRMRRVLRHKFTVERMIKEFKPGQKVIIRLNPSTQKGFPSPKLMGCSGTVKSKRGEAYIISLKKGNKSKEIIARAEHLKSAEK